MDKKYQVKDISDKKACIATQMANEMTKDTELGKLVPWEEIWNEMIVQQTGEKGSSQ